jgi:deazaflavin-dependent oxidoreductase (nitroreductase family)
MADTTPHYKEPGWFTRNVFNRVVAGLTGMGVSVMGSRVLEHKGRKSGEAHQVPVNLLTYEGGEYLVSPRGETQWVRNVRADGGRLVLLLGKERQARVATEVTGADKVPLLRAYLKRWKAEVGVFFEGVGPDSTDEELAAVAPRHPAFRLSSPGDGL